MAMIYAPSDPFNTPLEAIDPQSAAWMAMIAAAPMGGLANDEQWGVPVWHATYADPWVSMAGNEYFTGSPFSFHLPRNAAANTGSDGHMAVIGPSGQHVTEFWRFQRAPLSAAAVWQFDARGASCGQPSQGIVGGVTVSKSSLLAGLVLADELEAGAIDHALAITLPCTSPLTRAPALLSDGKNPNGVPMGARLRLDPAWSAPAQMPGWVQTICTTLQRWGAIVTDTGGSVAVMAESPVTGAYPDGVGGQLVGLPWSSMRVLA